MAHSIRAEQPSPLVRVNLGLLLALAAGLIALLGPQWLHKPDLSHGLFTPIASLILLHEARKAALAGAPNAPFATLLFRASLVLGLVALAAGGLYAAALEWSHPLVGFAFATSFALLLLATVIGFSTGPGRLVAFNWSSLLAAFVWVLSAPIPPGTYGRITLNLQLWVSTNVLHSLHILGIAASRHGNVIELARTSVGVEEACSGVRSLISCVFAGLFFSGCLVRRPWARALVIALAAPLAIAMNFVRSLVLTLLANAGVNIAGAWHDITGFSILAVTAVILALLALRLARGEKEVPVSAGDAGPPAGNPRLLASGLGLAVALMLFFVFHADLTPQAVRPVPNLEALVPATATGWKVETATDLDRFKDTLQTDHFVQRTYSRVGAEGLVQISVYVAYWAPGQANASLIDVHTPDWCWPAGGWEIVPVAQTQVSLAAGTRTLPAAQFRRFKNEGYPQDVWFWHLYDREPVPFIDPLSPVNLLKIAARYGFRHAGDQMFIRISSNLPWKTIAPEPLVAEILNNLQPYGL